MKNSDPKSSKKNYPMRHHRAATHVQVASHTIFRVKNTHFMATGIKPATSHLACYSFNYSTPYSLCPYEIFSFLLYSFDFEMSVWDPKRFKMKMFSTTKLYNFSISTTFVLVVSQSEVVLKIRISNMRNPNVIFPG